MAAIVSMLFLTGAANHCNTAKHKQHCLKCLNMQRVCRRFVVAMKQEIQATYAL
jgi:hypothetical protein